jgi:hypothetical protein
LNPDFRWPGNRIAPDDDDIRKLSRVTLPSRLSSPSTIAPFSVMIRITSTV